MSIQSITTDSPEVAAPVTDAPPAASFESFVQATAGSLHRTAVLLCADHHLAEDLTQTTYAKVFSSWRRVSRVEDPVAYTKKVLLRTFLSHRRLRRSGERPVDAVPEIAAAATADPHLRVDLLTALGELRPEDRAVLVLRFWEDLGSAEAARLLGISDAACRQRTSRALARLRVLVPDLEEDR